MYIVLQFTCKYRLDAEAKGSTGFRILKDVYKNPEGASLRVFMTSEEF